MAANVQVTPGTGDIVAAEDISNVKFQKIKLIDATASSTTPTGVEANPLQVALPAATVSTLTPPATITNFANETGGNLASIKTNTDKIPALGQALAAASVPVILPSATITTLTPPAAITGFATETTLGTVHGHVDSIDTKTPALGQALAASSVPVVLTAAQMTTLTPVSTVTATQGTGSNLKVEASNNGTFPTQSTAVGTIADDATTPGNPVMIGGMAVETDGTDPTSVSAEGDVAIARTDRNRRILVNDRHPNSFSFTLNHSTAQTDHELVAAPGANLSLYITDVIVSNGATAGTVLFEEDTATAKTIKIDVAYLAINGGFVANIKTPIRCTANKNFGFTSATCTTHTVTCMGYIAP